MNPTASGRHLLVAAALLGAIGVAAGAFGAHGLRGVLDERALEVWRTAVQYQMLHVVAALALTAWAAPAPSRPAHVAISCWLLGVVLFSGSLYVLALGGPRWLGPVTPLGGVAMIVGWVAAAVAAVRRS